jgi:polygalacturonase
MRILKHFVICLFVTLIAGAFESDAQNVNVKQFGAVGDGKTMDTKAIQQAIDACNKKGGGKVVIPIGTFLSGSIYLRSGVELYLSKGAVLLGSSKPADYEKHVNYALILAGGQHDIGIKGEGTVDGQGRELAQNVIKLWKAGLLKDNTGKDRPDEKYRPQIIDLEKCSNVTVSGITIKNSSCWVQTYDKCTNLIIDHIKVNSTAYWNNDGIDIVDCYKARITNCDINSADDGICLKSGDSTASCNDIYIGDCRIRSSASALKFGTASTGGFQHIKVRNLTIFDTYRSAIALECVDGGFIKDIDIQNVKATNTGNGIFIRLGKRRKDRPMGMIDSVLIKNVEVHIPAIKPDKGYETEGPLDKEHYNTLPSSIVGLPGGKIDHIKLENINLYYEGRSKTEYAYRPIDSLSAVPERPANYPEFTMFGELPAWGFYIRHAGSVTLKNVNVVCSNADYRPAIVADEVVYLKVVRLRVDSKGVKKEAIILKNVKTKQFKKLTIPDGIDAIHVLP